MVDDGERIQGLTFSSDTFPECSGESDLSGVILIGISGCIGVGGGATYLEVIDVDVEAAFSPLGEGIGEFFICFAQNSMLGVLQRFAIFVFLSESSRLGAIGISWTTLTQTRARDSRSLPVEMGIRRRRDQTLCQVKCRTRG